MYDNRQIIIGGNAENAVGRYRAVIYGALPDSFQQANGVNVPVGINANVNTALNERIDVVISGPHQGRLGAFASRGTWLKADGLGQLVPAAVGEWAIARAERSGNAGENIPVFVQPTKV